MTAMPDDSTMEVPVQTGPAAARLELRARPRKAPTQPRPGRLGLCWWAVGLSTTARQPKACRSMTRGSVSVSRWCGEMLTSAVDVPADVFMELCQSTA